MAMCVLHNFLLAGNDTWKATEADKKVVEILEERFYRSIIHSPYADLIVQDDQGGHSGGGDDDTNEGSAKRARLMAWLPRRAE
jgi:hypothetical protein